MGAYSVSSNGNIEIDLRDDYRDNGWSISGQVATHSGCNQGYITRRGYDYKVGVPNVFKYVVSGYSSGTVRLEVGENIGADISSNGLITETFTPEEGDLIRLYSDGNLSIQILEVFTATEDTTGNTISFDETKNQWRSYWSYRPDIMMKFKSDFFSFKNGQLWKHNTNEQRNTFYGVKYPSNIVFYVNLNPTAVKQFFTMREKSNKVWEVKEIYLFPTEGKQKGQLSRLKKNRFRLLQGDWFADFLRDMNDPRFNTQLQALMNGASLQGNVMRIEMENDDETEVRMLSVDIELAPHNYTY